MSPDSRSVECSRSCLWLFPALTNSLLLLLLLLLPVFLRFKDFSLLDGVGGMVRPVGLVVVVELKVPEDSLLILWWCWPELKLLLPPFWPMFWRLVAAVAAAFWVWVRFATEADLFPTICWCWDRSSWIGSRCIVLTGLLERLLLLPEVLGLLGVLVGTTFEVTAVFVAEVAVVVKAVVWAEVVDVDVIVVVVAVVELLIVVATGFSWLPKKGCLRIPELA